MPLTSHVCASSGNSTWAEEESDDMTRCFCKPTHSLLLKVWALSPNPRLDPANAKLFPVMTLEREGCRPDHVGA